MSLLRLGALAALLGGVVLAAWVGWFSPRRPWPEATGWDRIPISQRPTSTILFDDGPSGDAPPVLSWLGHNAFVLEWHGVRLLLDPNTSGHCSIAPRLLEPAANLAGLAGLGGVDGILLSHAHYDHLDVPTLESVAEWLGNEATVLLPRGSEVHLPDALRPAACPLEAGDRVRLGALEVFAVPAAHNGQRSHPLAGEVGALGYVIRPVGAPEAALYFAGDTGFGNDFAAIRDTFRPRVAILPIGAYSPRLILEPHHLSPEEAVRAAETLEVETVVPAHFGTFVLFFDRPGDALPRFARAAHTQNIRWVMPRLATSFEPPENP